VLRKGLVALLFESNGGFDGGSHYK
jgi:hypothetical protein